MKAERGSLRCLVVLALQKAWVYGYNLSLNVIVELGIFLGLLCSLLGTSIILGWLGLLPWFGGRVSLTTEPRSMAFFLGQTEPKFREHQQSQPSKPIVCGWPRELVGLEAGDLYVSLLCSRIIINDLGKHKCVAVLRKARTLKLCSVN